MIVGRLPFDIARKKPVSNQHRRELFLEETKRGMKTQKHQQLLGKCSYGEFLTSKLHYFTINQDT